MKNSCLSYMQIKKNMKFENKDFKPIKLPKKSIGLEEIFYNKKKENINSINTEVISTKTNIFDSRSSKILVKSIRMTEDDYKHFNENDSIYEKIKCNVKENKVKSNFIINLEEDLNNIYEKYKKDVNKIIYNFYFTFLYSIKYINFY